MSHSIKKKRTVTNRKKRSIVPEVPKRKPSILKTLKRRVVARTEVAAPDAKQQIGNEERLSLIVRRVVYLHGFECLPYRKIAKKIQDDFKLTVLPSISTICRWMTLGHAEFLEDINDMRKQLRLQQLQECEELKNQWFDAAHRKIEVARTRMRDGEQVEIVDENAFNEQAKAAMIYLKLLERQAKLIGLDLAGTETQEGGKQSAQDIYLWISEQIQNDPKLPHGKDVTHFGNLELCLDSGKESDM